MQKHEASNKLLPEGGVEEKDLRHIAFANSGFENAHTLVNRERVQRGKQPLKRSSELDRLCQVHAEEMASQTTLLHSASNLEELRNSVASDEAGENITRGTSVADMHGQAMSQRSSQTNILTKSFQEFGVATARGEDGKLYMVQVFRGPERSGSADDTTSKLWVPFGAAASFIVVVLCAVLGYLVKANVVQIPESFLSIHFP